MGRAKQLLQRLLHPPVWALVSIPLVSFAALIAVFVRQSTKNTLTYIVYGMSAYSLVLWTAAAPGVTRRVKSAIMNGRLLRKAAASPMVGRYFGNLAFRGSVSLYQGLAANAFYCIFRAAAGIRYASVWFLSMAAYYLTLGALRTYLIAAYRRRSPTREVRCYRTVAWLLFLLNIPMGGMIVLMVRTNSGFVYPGYVIYVSALYTFYTITTSIINLVKFRRLGSPLLSAAKVLNFVSAMMSVLGLQTAMISRFSVRGEEYRRMMNAITGGVVYGIVLLIAVFMLLRARKLGRKVETVE